MKFYFIFGLIWTIWCIVYEWEGIKKAREKDGDLACFAGIAISYLFWPLLTLIDLVSLVKELVTNN